MGEGTDLFKVELAVASADETADLARNIGAVLLPGDTLLLSGPVGAGKSHFCRSLIQSRLAVFNRFEDVPSPTFTLVQTYVAGDVELWHADLYRLSDPSELFELGLDTAFDAAICLVEWPDRLGSDAPRDALRVGLHSGETHDHRIITLQGPTQWRTRLTGVINHD
ncbi:hypothetical protein ACMU_01645 [Actibacterium mucosum KCTC 23349]|uniref:tRNA threonylcarbamoyladenosine biosynthesis protein TsaE n=1 Tax=Actibacterium mucosum KCTC 23349 TaxID=1454373 RepID=A0A037ZNT8_9RHOB|nr:tRNA (adenosine(37)-N6)-threonylcarbamoyltransferase complex ATPase subunit type 1 TsaE [Actibacterium mucosum]KAJ57223.1 hypothetical protein ACMU_01645 [Actibacterium mucosum KCTC 23349]